MYPTKIGSVLEKLIEDVCTTTGIFGRWLQFTLRELFLGSVLSLFLSLFFSLELNETLSRTVRFPMFRVFCLVFTQFLRSSDTYLSGTNLMWSVLRRFLLIVPVGRLLPLVDWFSLGLYRSQCIHTVVRHDVWNSLTPLSTVAHVRSSRLSLLCCLWNVQYLRSRI